MRFEHHIKNAGRYAVYSNRESGNGREPMQADVLYDRELKQRFGPWNRMLERAGTRPVAQSYLDKKRRRKEKRQRHKEYRRQIRAQQAAEAAQGETAAADAAK